MHEREKLIKQYFALGFSQKEILIFLKYSHGISISHRTLKRILSRSNLFRRKRYSKLEDIMNFMQQELEKSAQLHGYRWFHLKCLQSGLVVTQNIIRELLLYLDPIGVDFRKRKRLRRRQYFNRGPHFLWHLDSYDKLKPYGICINGCIDGFSRYIIWLKAGLTSNDPKVGISINIIQLTVFTKKFCSMHLTTCITDFFFIKCPSNSARSTYISAYSTIEWWTIVASL